MTVSRPIGLSTSMLVPESLDASIEFVERHGFGGIELWGDFPHAHPDSLHRQLRKRLRKRLRSFEWISVHAPLGNASLASCNPGIWRESVREHREVIKLAAEIGATVVVVHPGDLRDPRLEHVAWLHLTAALSQLTEVADACGVTLALENCGKYLGSLDENPVQLKQVLAEVSSPRLRACLDVGHAAVNRNLDETVGLLGPDVVHVHLHDNDGSSDQHLPMGWGSIDFDAVLPVLGPMTTVTAELTWPSYSRYRTRSADDMAEAMIMNWRSFAGSAV